MKLSRLLFFISGFTSLTASAFEPFQVKDIRVEGIQRTEPGTIFSYLPVRVGETMTEDKAAQAIRSLYATGFFKDVTLEAEGGVLVVVVQERPAIAQITSAASGPTVSSASSSTHRSTAAIRPENPSAQSASARCSGESTSASRRWCAEASPNTATQVRASRRKGDSPGTNAQ